MELGPLIKDARNALGWSQAELERRIGVSQVAIKKIEDGQTRRSKHLTSVLAAVGLKHLILDGALMSGDDEPEPNAAIAGQPELLKPLGGARDLPVMGTAVGGSEEDGDFRLNGDVLERTTRPPALAGRKRAFAVNLITNSMYPLYRAGKKIYADEDGRRPEIGDEVLLELYSDEDGEPGPVYVKTLVSRGAKTIVVSQYNPPKELRFDAMRVKQMLRIIPYDELLGV